MKKIVASVGLLAIGASGLQAAGASALTTEASKPWSISAALRGFYDDNINSVPDDSIYHQDSFGFEVSPSIQLVLPMDQGLLTAGYTYSFKYYDEELLNSTGHDVQTHMFNLGFDHAFTERYQLAIKDSFAIGQEPDILRAGNAMETYQRVPGDNMRNFGSINFDGALTRQVGYQLGYANTWMNYDDEGTGYGPGIGQVTSASTSGLLDRVEHIPHVDLRWEVKPETKLIAGYQYRDVDYTGDEDIAGDAFNGYVQSDYRSSRSHYGYVGVDHNFRPDLTGALRVGAQSTDYYNDPSADNQLSPYLLASLKYLYAADSTLEFGLTTDRNATDVIGSYNGGDMTLDQQTTVAYLALTHKITSKLFGTITGQYQYSEFNGGQYDGEAENYYMAGVNLEYRINAYFAAHVGYSFDGLDSDLPNRNMGRNRVYVGVTARY